MSEFPLLCLRGDACRRDGPRETGQRGWFCDACEDKMRDNLTAIAAQWADLEQAVTSIESVTGEQGKQKRGGKTHGIRVNHDAIDVKRQAEEVVAFMVHDLMDRYDEDDRDLRLPDDRSTPTLADWVARWHLTEFTSHPSDHVALEAWDDVSEVAWQIRNALAPRVRRIDTGLPCEEHGTSDMGERVPCPGRLRAYLRGDATPDLVCTEDRTHRISRADWMRSSWQRRASRDLDPTGVRELLRKIGVRHTSETG